MHTVIDVANYFLWLDIENEGDGISNLKLQKLAYYTQGFYSALYGKPLFPEHIEAWRYGPVVPSLYQQYKNNQDLPIGLSSDFNSNIFSKEEIDLLEEVYQVFGQYSAWKLRDMTYGEAPWLDNEKNTTVIPLEELTRYFKARLN
ncbi:MAG: DUF4065 domain-containing protein [Methylococcales bacterium]